MYSPTKEEFLELSKQGNLVPVTRCLLADIETPLSAYRKIRGPAESFLFESVEGGEHIGRYSFVGCNPRAVIRQVGRRIEVLENGKVAQAFVADGTGALPLPQGEGRPALRRLGEGGGQGEARVQSSSADLHVRDGLDVVERVMEKYRAVPVPGLPRFTGGAVGFIGYEFLHDVEPIVPRPPHDALGTPTMCFLVADQLLIFDRVAQTITILVNAVLEDAATPE